MKGPWMGDENAYRYKYNGIEEIDDFGLDLSFATFRTLDPAIGRWLQVDPAAEKYPGMNPYNSMGNNPMSFNDPQGDDFGASLLIGAAVGLISNGISNVSQGNNFFQGGLKAAGLGALSGAVSFGIGNAASSLSGLGKAAFQMGAHGFSGGVMSGIQGGSFGSGFLSGALSSGLSSGASALGIGNIGMIGIGGLSGGLGASLAGGNFWKGVGQGLTTSGLNHVAHSFLVDSQLRKIGLNPNSEAPFDLSSVKTVEQAESLQKLIKMGANPKDIVLGEGDKVATTIGGVVTLYKGNFKSWRYLATSYGHELVHILNVNLYWSDLNEAGYVGANGNLPKMYNELLAHSWSAAYSGIGQGAVRFYMTQSINSYPGLVKQFYQSQKLNP